MRTTNYDYKFYSLLQLAEIVCLSLHMKMSLFVFREFVKENANSISVEKEVNI